MISTLIGMVGCLVVLSGTFWLGAEVESKLQPPCTEQTAPPPTL